MVGATAEYSRHAYYKSNYHKFFHGVSFFSKVEIILSSDAERGMNLAIILTQLALLGESLGHGFGSSATR